MVNLDKSEAFFSPNIRDEVKEIIRNRMGGKKIIAHSRYLALPVIFGRSKKKVFYLIIKRI